MDQPATEPSRWTVGVHVTAAVLSMAMLYVSFPDPGIGMLAHVALAPLFFFAVRSPRPRLMLGISLLAAYVFWLARIAWLTEVTFGGYLALAGVMALYTPLSLLGIRLLVRRLYFPTVLAAPMVWVSLEFLRGYCPAGGFGWFALSHSQASYAPGQMTPILAQCADLFGEHGVSFLVAMSNGLAVDLVTRPLKRIHLRSLSGLVNSSMPAIFIWATAFILAISYGLSCTLDTAVDGDRVRLAVVQTNVPQSNKNHPTAESIESDFQHAVWLTKLASSGLEGMAGQDLSDVSQAASDNGDTDRPDLIVWPETMVPAGLNPEAREYYATSQTIRLGHEKFYAAIRGLSDELEIPLLVGAPFGSNFQVVRSRDGKHLYELPMKRYNSSYLIVPHSELEPLRYDKMHRVPFGEYVPWVDSLPTVKAFFMEYFTPYDFDYSLSEGETPTVFVLSVLDRTRAATQSSRQGELHSPWDGVRGANLPMLPGPLMQSATQPETQPAASVPPVTEPAAALSLATQPATETAPATEPTTEPAAIAEPLPRRVVHFATPICFEDTVPQVCRQMAYDDEGNKRIDVLINLTNDGWYPGWAQGRQHLQIATLRCIENRVPMARSVNTGVSGFITSLGQVMQLVEDHGGKRQEVEGYATADVTLDARKTLYGRVGDWPVAILIVITGMLFLAALIRGEPRAAASGMEAKSGKDTRKLR